jgi:hypothetical protein
MPDRAARRESRGVLDEKLAETLEREHARIPAPLNCRVAKEAIMRKFALLAGAGLILLGTIGSAEAQFPYRYGYYGGGWHGAPYYGGYRRGWGGGGAVAAGLIGGALLGGIIASAARPAYAYPAYSYGYAPAYAYGYPPAYYGGYYAAPAYQTRYVYGAPAYGFDPYAAPHEIRGGYRTVYRDGRRVIVGPAY